MERPAAESQIAGGVFVAVVGPSGAGKDSVIHHAQSALANEAGIVFVRRVITRPSDPDAEDHDTLDEAEFAEAESHGSFALTWAAHGLRYGLPASIDARLAGGNVLVANVSRAAIPALKERYRLVTVVEITAAPEVLAQRLSARGRESRGEVLARLARSTQLHTSLPGVVTIDNSGPLDIAGDRFVMLLREKLVS